MDDLRSTDAATVAAREAERPWLFGCVYLVLLAGKCDA